MVWQFNHDGLVVGVNGLNLAKSGDSAGLIDTPKRRRN